MREITFNDKVVGFITENGKTYITHRDPEIHLFKKYNGYGISKKVLNELKCQSVQNIIIRTPDMELLYSLEDFVNSSLEYKFEEDIQKFISLS